MKHMFHSMKIFQPQTTMEDFKIIFGIIMSDCILAENFMKKQFTGYKMRCF